MNDKNLEPCEFCEHGNNMTVLRCNNDICNTNNGYQNFELRKERTMELDEALKASEQLREAENKCYWIAVPGRMARTDCTGDFLYLPNSRGLPDEEILTPYVGTVCPKCGKPIYIDENSYNLVKNES